MKITLSAIRYFDTCNRRVVLTETSRDIDGMEKHSPLQGADYVACCQNAVTMVTSLASPGQLLPATAQCRKRAPVRHSSMEAIDKVP